MGVAVTQIGGSGYNRAAVFTASGPPTATNDSAASPAHQVGDVIIDTTNGATYKCYDNTASAAKWVREGFNEPAKVAISAAAGTANVSLVTFQVQDVLGNNVAAVVNMDVTLSDAATGAGLTATTASGTVVAGASGTDLGDYTAKKAKRVQTDATGKYILAITDTVKTGFYPCAQIPGQASLSVGAQLNAAKYG